MLRLAPRDPHDVHVSLPLVRLRVQHLLHRVHLLDLVLPRALRRLPFLQRPALLPAADAARNVGRRGAGFVVDLGFLPAPASACLCFVGCVARAPARQALALLVGFLRRCRSPADLSVVGFEDVMRAFAAKRSVAAACRLLHWLRVDVQVGFRLPRLVGLLLVAQPFDLVFEGALSSPSAPSNLPLAGWVCLRLGRTRGLGFSLPHISVASAALQSGCRARLLVWLALVVFPGIVSVRLSSRRLFVLDLVLRRSLLEGNGLAIGGGILVVADGSCDDGMCWLDDAPSVLGVKGRSTYGACCLRGWCDARCCSSRPIAMCIYAAA